MDKLEEVQKKNLGDQDTGIRSQRELEELLAQREARIEQQSKALEQAEMEILRLRAELYEYLVQVVRHQQQQIQELSQGSS